MTEMGLFLQSTRRLPACSAIGAEIHKLLALDPPDGGSARLVLGGESGISSDAPSAYRLRLVQDSGLAPEPYGVIMLVAFDIPPVREAEVDRWYVEEHIPLLMRADGWLRARRFTVEQTIAGRNWTSLAFHELRDVSVMDSAERAFARSTPWRARLKQESWFRQAGRWVYAPAPGAAMP